MLLYGQSTAISVAIIAPSPALGLGLRSLLERYAPEFRTVGTYRDLASFHEQAPPELDVIMLDTAILGFSLDGDIRELFPRYAKTLLVAVTIEFILPDAHASFNGVLHLYDEAEQIVRHLKTIYETSLSPTAVPDEDEPGNYALITDREREIIVAIARGRSNKEIADDLCLSPHTVSTYRKRISSKLGIRGAAGFTTYAMTHKLTDR